MWKLSLYLKGAIIILVCLWSSLQNASCQTFKTKNYGYAVPSKSYVDSTQNQGDYSLHEKSVENNNINWRDSQYTNGDSTVLTDKETFTGEYKKKYSSGSSAVLRDGSIVLRPSSVSPERLIADDDRLEPEFGAVLGQFSGSPIGFVSQFRYPGPLVSTSGLLRLLFGYPVNPFDRYLSFCNRMTAFGRFLRRLFEPLFTTGFYMAASYFFRMSVLPRIAHYIHVYTMMKDHDHARLDSGSFRDFNHLSASVNDVINDGLCLQQIVCKVGLIAAGHPIARSIHRIAKNISPTRHELVHIFKESLTGSLSDCSQYSCNNQRKL